jgi:hypothetical protein
MGIIIQPGSSGDGEFGIRKDVTFGDVADWVRENDDFNRKGLGIPTQDEVELSTPDIAVFQCDPFLKPEEILEYSKDAKAIVLVTFASGAMPDRLAPAIEQRLREGVAVVLLSDNAGDGHGILKMVYAAGERIYEAGAVPLEKVNIMNHTEVKAAIQVAIDEGLSGRALAQKIGEMYSYKPGEEKPVAQWDQPGFELKPSTDLRAMMKKGGFIDDDGNYLRDGTILP